MGPDTTIAFSPDFDIAGFKSSLLIRNMGSLFMNIIFAFLLSFIAMALLLIKSLPKKLRVFLRQGLNNFYWNGVIAIIRQNYLLYTIATYVNIFSIDFTDLSWLTFDNIFCFVMLTVISLLPIYLFFKYMTNYDKLKDSESQESVTWGNEL